jgi:LysR family transcriptional regulator, low CO2-responsive transcriptional regulator
MTPTQLRAFSAVVRLGSVKQAAVELKVSESAVSLNIGQLRKELGDQLFTRTAAGLAFTPGGLRLASRSAELLGLQDRTIIEVGEAATGRRLLRLAASSLFAEHAAPGLIELFAGRAADLDVELSVRNPGQFNTLLLTRAADIAIGPEPPVLDDAMVSRPIMNLQIILVVGPDHPMATVAATAHQLRDQTWLLGPSAAADLGAMPEMLRRLAIPEERQQIFQSHAAAIEEAKRSRGVAPVLSYAVSQDLARGQLVKVTGAQVRIDAVWHALMLAERGTPSAAAELARFASTPRAIQAMVRGKGVSVGHFKPSIHVTLWS